VCPRDGAHADRQHETRNERDRRELGEQVAARHDRGGAFGLDIETDFKKREGLARLERFLAAFNRCDESFALLFRLAHAGEHVELRRGVHHPGDHEDEDDRRRDQEQLFVEAHSCN